MKNKKLTSILMYLVLFIAFAALFLALRWFYSTRKTTIYERPTTPVEVTTPRIRTLTKVITLSSYVSAEDTVSVVPYLDGTILSYNVKEDDYVNEGDIIATIDTEPYELQSAFDKVEKLYQMDSASKQDYDSVKAQRDAFKAQYELAELQLSYTQVKAKTNGTILKTLSSQGSTASKGTPIAIIADLNDLTVNLNLGEQYFGLFSQTNDKASIDAAKGTSATSTKAYAITVTRPASQYTPESSTSATIKAVSPYVDASSRNFKLYLKLDDPSAFNPGMYVKVSIAVETQTGYSIERRAMKLDGDAYYIQTLQEAQGKSGANAATPPAATANNPSGPTGICTVNNIDLSKAFATSEYVIVPDEYKDEKFVIKGQNDIFAGQPVTIVKEEASE